MKSGNRQPKEKGLSPKEYNRQWKKLNRERVNAENLARYHKNKVLVPDDQKKVWNKRDDPDLPEIVKVKRKAGQSSLEYRKEYERANKERILILKKKAYQRDRDKFLESSKKQRLRYFAEHGESRSTAENRTSKEKAFEHYENWTVGEEETLIRMAGSFTHREIAEKVGRTLAAVREKLRNIRKGKSSSKEVKVRSKTIKPEGGVKKLGKREYSRQWWALNRESILEDKRKKWRESYVSKHKLGKAHRTIEDPTLPDIIKPDKSIFKTAKEYQDEWNRLNRERVSILKARNYSPEESKQRNKDWQQKHREKYGMLKASYENSLTVPGAYDRWQAWTLKEIELVGSGKYTDEELTKMMGRTLAAVKWRRLSLGIKKRERKG